MINVIKYGLSLSLVVISGFAAIDLTRLNGPVLIAEIEYVQTMIPSVTDEVHYEERVTLYPNNTDLYVISRDPRTVETDSLHYYLDGNKYNYQDSSPIPRLFLIALGLAMLAWFLYENRTKTVQKEK